MSGIHLKCNVCWKTLNGPFKSYKLTCLHVFCSTCFRKSVDSTTMMNPKCPACDSTSTETTELEISGELAPDTKSKVVSALYNNPTYWQGVLSEANQFMKASCSAFPRHSLLRRFFRTNRLPVAFSLTRCIDPTRPRAISSR